MLSKCFDSCNKHVANSRKGVSSERCFCKIGITGILQCHQQSLKNYEKFTTRLQLDYNFAKISANLLVFFMGFT